MLRENALRRNVIGTIWSRIAAIGAQTWQSVRWPGRLSRHCQLRSFVLSRPSDFCTLNPNYIPSYGPADVRFGSRPCGIARRLKTAFDALRFWRAYVRYI